MVTEEKITAMVLARYRLGSVMIWLGVLTWLPFIVLRVAGEKPSLFWFLPIHLLGVVGGARLRAYARKEIGARARSWIDLYRHFGLGALFLLEDNYAGKGGCDELSAVSPNWCVGRRHNVGDKFFDFPKKYRESLKCFFAKRHAFE